MIYTLTFNPAIDYVMRISRLNGGETNRSQSEEIQFGGKGINVSTVLANLGLKTVALGFLAGAERGYIYALELGSATAFAMGLATKDEIMALCEKNRKENLYAYC